MIDSALPAGFGSSASENAQRSDRRPKFNNPRVITQQLQALAFCSLPRQKTSADVKEIDFSGKSISSTIGSKSTSRAWQGNKANNLDTLFSALNSKYKDESDSANSSLYGGQLATTASIPTRSSASMPPQPSLPSQPPNGVSWVCACVLVHSKRLQHHHSCCVVPAGAQPPRESSFVDSPDGVATPRRRVTKAFADPDAPDVPPGQGHRGSGAITATSLSMTDPVHRLLKQESLQPAHSPERGSCALLTSASSAAGVMILQAGQRATSHDNPLSLEPADCTGGIDEEEMPPSPFAGRQLEEEEQTKRYLTAAAAACKDSTFAGLRALIVQPGERCYV